MNKKAQSQIITTVLIILLVLAAIVIVWQVVRNTVETGAGSITTGTDCIEINLDIVSADISANTITVTRKAGGADDAISNVKFLVDGSAVTATNPTDPALGILETGIWTIITPILATDDKVEVAAVLKDGTTVCDVSDTQDAVA